VCGHIAKRTGIEPRTSGQRQRISLLHEGRTVKLRKTVIRERPRLKKRSPPLSETVVVKPPIIKTVRMMAVA
jgi:hypothetical protein